MSDEKRRSKRQSAPVVDEGMWECSMCTYKNPPEFFKCEICECRKGTSTRKPRPNLQLIAQQAAQSVFTPPPPAKKERKERRDRKDRDKSEEISAETSYEEESLLDNLSTDAALSREASPAPASPPASVSSLKKEPSTSRVSKTPEPHTSKCHKKKPARLKNIDRNSGHSMDVTVGNVTVTITDYKPLRKERSHGSDKTPTGKAGSGKAESTSSTPEEDSSLSPSTGVSPTQHAQTRAASKDTTGHTVNGELKANS